MGKKQKEGKKRIGLHEYGAHNDIKYRGPLSYQEFQILGWLCIATLAIILLIKLGVRIDKNLIDRLAGPASALDYIAKLSLPFLLIANFAKILNNSEGYKTQLVRNGAAFAAIALVFLVFFNRYIIGALALVSKEPNQVMPVVLQMFRLVNANGFLAFNIFVDLFLCTLFMFFLDYRPKRVFTGRWIIAFRLLAILPVAYEVVCMILKGMSAQGDIALPIWSFPLLTVKPPMTFVLFMALALFVKTRERRFCRHGKSHEEYEAFLQTNRNSLHFSIFLAIALIVVAILDAAVFLGLSVGESLQATAREAGSIEAIREEDFVISFSIATAVGFGDSIPLMFVAPIVLLFSYTRVPKSKTIGILIPIAGIALIAVILLQGVYQLLSVAPIPKIDFREISRSLEESLRSMSGA